MAYKALSELVVVFSKQLKLKIRTKVGFANSASDLFSILLNFHASYLFCNVHMSLQRLLPSTTALPPIGSSVSSVFLLEELDLLKHSVQIKCTEDLYSSWKVFLRGNRVRPLFLNTGVTRAILNWVGNLPVDMLRIIISAIHLDST